MVVYRIKLSYLITNYLKELKHFISDIFNEFVYGSHLVSLGAIGIVLSIVFIFEKDIQYVILLVSYLVIQIIYTYNHFREIQFDLNSNPERSAYINSKMGWVRFSLILYSVLLVIFLFFTNLLTSLLVFVIVLIGILYTEYLKHVQIWGFKNYTASFFWSLMILLVPFFYGVDDALPYLYLVTFIFIRGVINTTFFDLKDIEDDRLNGVKTFPVYFGKRNALYMLHFLNFVSFLPLFIGVYTRDLPLSTVFLSVTIFVGAIYLLKGRYMDDAKLRFISYVIVDGEYLFWPLAVIFGRLLI